MFNDKHLEEFKEFIRSHFNLDRNYSELEEVVREFKNIEPPQYSEKLLKEAKYIINLNDWEYIHDFMLKHGFRNYDKDRLVEMVWTIIRVLSV